MEMPTTLRYIVFCFLFLSFGVAKAQELSPNDTIRLGAIEYKGGVYPFVFLPEAVKVGAYMSQEDRLRISRLRRDLYVTYPYALTAAAILKDVDANLEKLDGRRDRKRYLKEVDRQLDVAFKQPLKNLTIDQGHVLIKLINRQTGKDCYSIIRELKNGVTAVMWQSVGVVFNNNLRRDYDPEGDDKELESLVQALEASSYYRYQLHKQQELLSKVPSRTVAK